MTISERELIQKAKEVSLNAYSPYSHFLVGAALLTESGSIYTGCNIENGGIQSICAERVSFGTAISRGERKFTSLAVVGKSISDPYFVKTLPCGYCRQFISEFCAPSFRIYTYDEKTDQISTYSLSELLPHSFQFKN